MTSAPEIGKHRRLFIIVLLLATILGAGLRLWRIGQRDFWFDESCTFLFVDQLYDWPDDRLLIESTNLPYYALLHAWTSLVGHTEADYRSLSAVAAIAAIPLLGWLACSIGGRRAGMVCATLTALHPLHIYYAREARAYSLWTLGISVWLACFWCAMCKDKSGKWWMAFVLAALFCLHTHYYSIFLLPAFPVAAWLITSGKKIESGNNLRVSAKRRRHCLLATCAAVAAFVPYVLVAVLPASADGGSLWIGTGFDPWTCLPRTLWAFMPAGGYPGHLRGLSVDSPDAFPGQAPWLIAVSSALPAMLLVVTMVAYLRRNSQRRSVVAAALVMILMPLVLAWGYSVLIRPIYLAGRYDLVALPPFLVAISLLVGNLTSRRVVQLLTLVLAACTVVPVMRMLRFDPPESFHHRRARSIAASYPDVPRVVTFSHDREYLAYYLRVHGFTGEIIAFPNWLNGQVGWIDHASDVAALQSGAVDQSALQLAEGLARKPHHPFLLLHDSLEFNSRSVRSAINQRFFEALKNSSFTLVGLDQNLRILRGDPPSD